MSRAHKSAAWYAPAMRLDCSQQQPPHCALLLWKPSPQLTGTATVTPLRRMSLKLVSHELHATVAAAAAAASVPAHVAHEHSHRAQSRQPAVQAIATPADRHSCSCAETHESLSHTMHSRLRVWAALPSFQNFLLAISLQGRSFRSADCLCAVHSPSSNANWGASGADCADVSTGVVWRFQDDSRRVAGR